MIHQLHIAKSGLFAYMRSMQTITNNIANAQTVSFKGQRVQTESLFPLAFARTISEFEDVNVPVGQKRKKFIQYGTGTRVQAVERNFRQGTIEVTNQPLDLAIEGDGFFQIRLPDGTSAYTRAGNFHTDRQGNLLTPNGHPLEPAVTFPNNITELSVTEEGRVFVQINNDPNLQEIGQFILARFQNPWGLQEIGQNLYVETPASGPPTFETPSRGAVGRIRHRALEFSNVDIVNELFKMILTQRNFELLQKTFSAGDKMLATASDLTR